VVEPSQRIKPAFPVSDANRRLVLHLALENQVTRLRLRPREAYACSLANEATASVAADQIVAAEPSSVRQMDVDMISIVVEVCEFAPAIECHCKFRDPVGETALDLLLP